MIGAGLIGGSLLRAAEKAGRTVWGSCASAETAQQATADGFDVGTDTDAALRRAAEADALVVLAVPLPALPDLLRRVDRVAPGCRLTDAVSVKVATADAVRRYAPRARYVGGHPMAGTAESGWAAGQAGLFTDAAWVVAADDGLDPEVWADVAELAWACGARVVPAAADEHDLAVAKISHLPHLFAAVLAAVGAAGDRTEADALALAWPRPRSPTGPGWPAPARSWCWPCARATGTRCSPRWTTRWAGWARCAGRSPRPAAWPPRCAPGTPAGSGSWPPATRRACASPARPAVRLRRPPRDLGPPRRRPCSAGAEPRRSAGRPGRG